MFVESVTLHAVENILNIVLFAWAVAVSLTVSSDHS